MKVLIPILIGLLVVGCGKKETAKPAPNANTGIANNTPEKPVKVLTAEEKKVFGEFEYKNRDGYILRYVLLENGVLEIQGGRSTLNMAVRESSSDKWKMANGEIHFVDGYNSFIDVFRINKDKSITAIAYISDGERTDLPKNKQEVFKEVKNTKPTSETKEPTANVGKGLKPEDVVGSYEAGLGGITFRFVLLESGVVENYFNGIKEPEDAKWKIQGAEVHIEKGKSDGTVIVNKIEPNGDLTVFARIRNGKREDFQKGTYKKIKSPKATPSKSVEINDPIVEKAIRESLKKPAGELNKVDLQRLSFLDLRYTKTTDAGLKEVAHLKTLTWLRLDHTKITDAGLEEVAKLKSLSHLFLFDTQITDVGLKEVARLDKLKELWLSRTLITDKGLKDLAKLKKLKLLYLRGTKVTRAGVAELQKALPNCKIDLMQNR